MPIARIGATLVGGALLAFLGGGCDSPPCDDGADCPPILLVDSEELVARCDDLRGLTRVKPLGRNAELWRPGDGSRETVALADLGMNVPEGTTLFGFSDSRECERTAGSGYAFSSSLAAVDVADLVEQARDR